MGQTTLILMIITVISKIFGFVRESVMAAYIGAGELKSVYTTATTIPAFLTNIVVVGIASGYIPVYNKVSQKENSLEADKFTSNLINILLLFGLIIMVLVLVFAESICKILSPNLSGELLKEASIYTRILILGIYGFFYASVIRGYLNVKKNFVDPALTGLIFNTIIILSTVLTGIIGNFYILVVGTLVANVLQYIRFPIASRKLGFKYIRTIDLSDSYIRYLFLMVIPIIISSAADQLSIIVDDAIASAFFGMTSVSKIFYAKTMLNFIMGVVTLSVTTVTFPDIAKAGQEGNFELMKSKTSSAVVFSMLLVIPATLGMMALSNPIIKLAFERNAFTSADTNIVASILVSYAPYIIFTSLIKIMANGFYSVGDSMTPVIIVLIQQVINVILNIVLIKFFDINGLGYATSISTAIGSLILVLAFSNKFGEFEDKKDIFSLLKILSSSIIMIIIARSIFKALNSSLILSLLISVLVAGIAYLLLVKLLKINEVEIMYENMKSKFSKE